MPSIFMHYYDAGACTYYRAIGPLKACRPDLMAEGIGLEGGEVLEQEGRFDAYVFQGLPDPKYWQLIQAYKEAGKCIVWSLDDNLWDIPDRNHCRQYVGKKKLRILEAALALADYVFVSTEALANRVGAKAWVLPNLIHPYLFPRRQPRRDGEPVRIVWAGSPTHDPDLELIAQPLRTILREYGDRVRVIFFGYLPNQFAAFCRKIGSMYARIVPNCANCLYVDPVPFGDYYSKLVQIGPDIALCPLADNAFNRSKSNIKWLEMVMAGARDVLVSNVPCYQDASFKVAPDKWEDAIKLALEPGCWISELDQELVANRYSWLSPSKGEWLKAFRVLARGE